MGGRPSVGIDANLPKMRVNIKVVNTGWIINHNGPKIVCLYIATKSLLTNKNNKSL